jgi:zinc protease
MIMLSPIFDMKCVLSRQIFQGLGVLFLLLCPSIFLAEDNKTTLAAVPKLKLEHFQLLNGLQVVTAELPQAQSIAVQLLIKHGTSSYNYPPGIVALLVSLWTDAGANSPARLFQEGEIPFAIRMDPDSIVIQAECNPDALDFSLRLISRLVMPAEISDASWERVRQQLLSRLHNTGPLELGRIKFAEALFDQHPYAQPMWGDPESIQKITREQVVAFTKEQIKPNQSALILAGALSNLELGDLIRSRLGAWVKEGHKPQNPPPLSNRGSSVSLSLEVKTMSGSLILFGVGMPPRLSDQYYELTFLNRLLGGGGSSSRLSQEFSRRNIHFSQLESQLDLYRAGGQLQIVAQLAGDELVPALDGIKNSLESFKILPAAPEELEVARDQLLREYESVMRNPNQLAQWLGQLELYDIAPAFLAEYAAAMKAVTPERIQQVAKQCLSSIRTVTILVRGTLR